MRNMSSTATQVISTTKMAVAIAFCGAAMVAAAAAAAMVPKKPDLIIRKMAVTQNQYGENVITIYYQNIGTVAVNQPFNIFVAAQPKNVISMPNNNPYPPKLTPAQESSYKGSGIYIIPVDTPNLLPGAVATKQIWLAAYDQKNPPSEVKIRAIINRDDKISELNTNNNLYDLIIPFKYIYWWTPEDKCYGYGYGYSYGYAYGYNGQSGCTPSGSQYGYNSYQPTYGYN